MKLSIPASERDSVLSELSNANKIFQDMYPGDSPERQPVQTVYGGANLFKGDTVLKMAGAAKQSLKSYAPNFAVLAKALELPGYEGLPENPTEVEALVQKLNTLNAEEKVNHPAWIPYAVYQKILRKLENEAVEDFRIDFEDGFGNRPDDEEDATAVQAANEVAKGINENTLSPFIGIRIKPFTEELKKRGVRTLDIFISTLLEKTNGKLPSNFVVTLPKVQIPEQVTALVRLFELLEKNNGLKEGTLKMEIMIETTQSIINPEGGNALRGLVNAGEGRCTAAHFGTYDYTASCNITAKYQAMDHPVCDFAHHMMKVALAGTGIFICDGATNVMPVGPHRGANLSKEQEAENTMVVHRAWKLAYDHIRHSMFHGFYQGWDLHPAQLPIRYAAVYSFFLESYDAAVVRLRNFIDKAGQATLSGDVFDDAATGQGLLNYFLSAINCGAVSVEEAMTTGLTHEEFKTRSFVKILDMRKNLAKA